MKPRVDFLVTEGKIQLLRSNGCHDEALIKKAEKAVKKLVDREGIASAVLYVEPSFGPCQYVLNASEGRSWFVYVIEK
jgi:hypothetical protein